MARHKAQGWCSGKWRQAARVLKHSSIPTCISFHKQQEQCDQAAVCSPFTSFHICYSSSCLFPVLMKQILCCFVFYSLSNSYIMTKPGTVYNYALLYLYVEWQEEKDYRALAYFGHVSLTRFCAIVSIAGSSPNEISVLHQHNLTWRKHKAQGFSS